MGVDRRPTADNDDDEELDVSASKYKRLIAVDSPGLLVILIDQSESMDGEKAHVCSQAVNRTIQEVILKCRSGVKIKDRVYFIVIGYGESIDCLISGKSSEVANRKTTMQKIPGSVGADGEPRPAQDIKVWVEPKANGRTPMAGALKLANELVKPWCIEHEDSFPPVVINITDGLPNDFDDKTNDAPETRSRAEKLKELSTKDGNLLLYNAHISDQQDSMIELPSDAKTISDKYARFLFSLSSPLPQCALTQALLQGLATDEGARGLVFNANAKSLVKFLSFGSSMNLNPRG